MRRFCFSRYSIAFLLYLLALLPRLYGIATPAPEPDEVHWLARSGGVLENIEQKRFSQLTTHLGHPGVPAGCLMALGQYLADAYDAALSLERDDARYIDRLTGARIANAVFSSLLIPLLFLGASARFGYTVAALAAVLVGFDPRHIGLSRIAHIDSILSVFALLSFGYYYLAVERRSVGLKLVAGLFWGLAIATKPTAMALLPAFLLFKLVLRATDRKRIVLHEPVVAWSDVWAVLAGHLIFALIYTRLWPHDSDYLHRLAVRSGPADFIYIAGMRAREYGAMFWAFVSIALGVVVRALWKMRTKERGWVLQLQLLVGTLLLAALIYPAVCENIIRFWYWVAGLSEVKHSAYNRVLPPPPGGYVGLLLVRLPSIALISLFGGLGVWILNHRRMMEEPAAAKQAAILLLSAMTLVAWIVLLSSSSKQTIRYLIPALAAAYLLAAFGYVSIVRRLGAVTVNSQRGLCVLFACFQLNAVAKIHPYYEFFFNDLSGGLAGAASRGHPLPLAEPRELLDTLLAEAKRRQQGLSVGVFGDVESIRLEGKRRAVGDRVLFHPETDPHITDFVLATGWRLAEQERERDRSVFARLKPVQEILLEGVKIAALYALPVPSYDEPHRFDVVKFHRPIGRELRVEGSRILEPGDSSDRERRVVGALPHTDKKGFVLSGYGIRLPAGRFRLSIDIAVPDLAEFNDRSPSRLAVRLDLGKSCQRPLQLGELTVGGTTTVSLECELRTPKRLQVTTYWFGTVPVLLDNLKLERLL